MSVEFRVYRDGVLDLATRDDRLAILRARNLKEVYADTASVVIVLLDPDEIELEGAGYPGRPLAVSAVEQAAQVWELERAGLAE